VIRRALRVVAALSAVVVMAWGWQAGQQRTPAFPHALHARLFISCQTCHAGVTTAGAPVFPPPSTCANCHNGSIQPVVNWQPRAGPRPSNLQFNHLRHATARELRGDSSACTDCHADVSATWMQVRAPVAPQCVSCHTQGRFQHLTQPDTACATCHVPLARATALPDSEIAKFPAPPSHLAADFLTAKGHGALATPSSGGAAVSASCATCHARDFCVVCHVNAPETRAIQALEPDRRSLMAKHELIAPASHQAKDFETRHGALAGQTGAACATCHTRESCVTCHVEEPPRAALALFPAGPGRARGAVTMRTPPASHVPDWATRHGPVASATLQTCTSCHARESCLTCHKPDASRKGSYHPADYLTRHPADAYTRASSCTDCHNTGEFCQRCHQQAGLSAQRALLGSGGYHDGSRQFALGHGQAARQGLESCVTCHAERDCLTCHSAVAGRNFNPHGPGFDAKKMLAKNPSLCIACHGLSIPPPAKP
jgi:Doubled CXXCH motif (Paired_CXXCH_1)